LDLQRSGAAWLGQEVSSGFTLAARAARSQLALRTCGARSRLAHARSFFFALQKYMNSYMITAKKKYEFIDNMNSYLNEFISSSLGEAKNYR
jgi:hypothetical protein